MAGDLSPAAETNLSYICGLFLVLWCYGMIIFIKGGVFVSMVRIFGMVVIAVSWAMVLVGFFKNSDLQKQGCFVFLIGLLIFIGSYISELIK